MAAPRTPQELYDRLISIAPDNFQGALQGAEQCRLKGSKEVVYFNLRSAAAAALRTGMALIRHGKDLRAGMDWFRKGADLAKPLLGYLQPPPASPWSGHHITYCNLLVGDFATAEAVGRWMVSIEGVPAELMDTGDPFAVALGYFVLDDAAGLERARIAFMGADGSGVHPYFSAMLVYIDLYEAVLARNQSRFDQLMEAREKFFAARNRERDGRLEFGGGPVRVLVLDFMGIGIARTAVARGLSFNQDTVHVPKAAVQAQ